MRRLLSFHRSHTPPDGGGARLSPYLPPPPLFRFLSPSCPIGGVGALPQFRPSPLFDGGEKNGTYNHSR